MHLRDSLERRIRKPILIAGSIFTLLSGCSGGSDSSPGPTSPNPSPPSSTPTTPTNNPPTQPTSQTYTLGQNEISSLSSVNSSSLTFSSPMNFNVGDVVGSGISTKTPYGLLRKVNSVSSDKKTFSTSPAAFEEAVKNSQLFSRYVSLPPSSLISVSGMKGVSYSVENSFGTAFDFGANLKDVVLFDQDGKSSTTNDRILANGSISFDQDFGLDFEVENSKLKYFEFGSFFNESSDLTISSNALGLASALEVKLAEYKFSPFVIGYLPTPIPLPIIVSPNIELSIKLDPTSVNPLSVKVEQSTGLNSYIKYSNGAWTKGNSAINSFGFSVPSPSSGVELKVSAGPKLEMLIYESSGPYASIKGKMRYSSQNQLWSLYAGAEATLGVDIGLFGKNITSFGEKVYDFETLLKQGTFGSGGPTTPPSPADRILFTTTRTGNGEIYAMNSDGSQLQNLSNNSSHDYEASWSANKDKIVFVSERGGRPDIYIMDFDGTDQTRLTFSTGTDQSRYPNFSPNGQEIIYMANRSGSTEMWVMNSNGSNPRKINLPSGVHTHPKFSPDGNQILFASSLSGGTGGLEIYRTNRDGTGIQRLTNNSAVDIEPSWCGSSTILFSSNRTSNYYDIWTMDINGNNLRNLSSTSVGADDYKPSCSPDGTKIAYAYGKIDRSSSDIYVMNLDGSGKVKITTRTSDSNVDPSWTSR